MPRFFRPYPVRYRTNQPAACARLQPHAAQPVWRLLPLLSAALALFLLTGCGAPGPAATPTPTKTPKPPATATAVPATATPLPLPTDTPVATATPVPTDTPLPTATPAPTDTSVPPTSTPVRPTNTPRPRVVPPTNTPAPPPVADPCAGIGGDGCKFKVRGGPGFQDNGGGELKMQLAFVHSGVDGGQPQGDYRIRLFKDGQPVPGPENVLSTALTANQGPLGKYNWEFAIPAGQLPGGNVGGSYSMHVLDGNRERDSRDFTFSLGNSQGFVWILWDQS